MAITFDLLERFQENKVFQTAQTMNNILMSNTKWSLAKNCPKLDKNKSVVSRFSVFVVYKSAVSTVQKSSYVGCFNFRQ